VLGDEYEKIAKWHDLFTDPVWVPKYNISLDEHREEAMRKLRKV
jgi:hypothetical protein